VTERSQTPPLMVSVENNLLTVRTRQQPLIQIVYEMAARLTVLTPSVR
jgi:hypothetical protein